MPRSVMILNHFSIVVDHFTLWCAKLYFIQKTYYCYTRLNNISYFLPNVGLILLTLFKYLLMSEITRIYMG